MSLLPEVANPYVAAVSLGFLYGLVFCTSTCLPFIASYIAGINAGFRRGVTVTLIFNAGRVTAYAVIGVAIGLLKLLLDTTFQKTFQIYSSFVFSIITIAVGVTILLQKKQPGCDCPAKVIEKGSFKNFTSRFDVRAYTLGLSRGLLLCAPLLAILAYSVSFAAPFDSFALAILFGIGTTLSPMLVLGGATGWLLNKAPLFRSWISRFGAIALIVLGVVTLVNAMII